MKINLSNGHSLSAGGYNISHSDTSGRVNLAEEVAAFLRSRGIQPEIEKVSSLDIAPFCVKNEITFKYLDIVKLACFLERRATG